MKTVYITIQHFELFRLRNLNYIPIAVVKQERISINIDVCIVLMKKTPLLGNISNITWQVKFVISYRLTQWYSTCGSRPQMGSRKSKMGSRDGEMDKGQLNIE